MSPDVLLIHRLLALGTVNNTLVATKRQRLLGGYVFNTSAAVNYLKLYDKATAPAAGTDIPVATLALPIKTPLYIPTYVGECGLVFQLGFGYALTNLQADSDTTAPTAGDVVVNFLYTNA